MSKASVNSLDMSVLTEGLSQEAVDILLDPARDPALVMPDFPESDAPAAADEIPTIDAIEAALHAHVRNGVSPHDLIKNLFHPFLDNAGHISLDPGQGKKRPSYAMEISPYGFVMPRVSTRVAAERLHSVALRLAKFEIGDRTHQSAPKLQIEARSYSSYATLIEMRAKDIQTAQHAYMAAFGNMPASIRVDLGKNAFDIIPHVLAAREIIAQGELGAPVFRKQAADLIAAVEDLRAVATIALRRNPDINRYGRYWIEIAPGKPDGIKIISNCEDEASGGHARVKHAIRHRALLDAVNSTVSRHTVLESLPEGHEVHLNGELQFLLAEVVDTTAPGQSIKRSISCSELEYDKITDLAERLAGLHQALPVQDHSWHLSLSGRLRCRGEWTLKGPTLAQAIANAVREKDGRSSMMLFDLLIDLFGDSDGEPVDVELYRVL